jgi:hypothetical protein
VNTRRHLAKRWFATGAQSGMTLKCTCGEFEITGSSRRDLDEQHRAHRFAMGEDTRLRKAERVVLSPSDAELGMLRFALDVAWGEMTVRDGFTDEEVAALESLRGKVGLC